MFRISVAEFITNSMKIELESIISKINEPDLEKYKVQLIEMVEYFTQELIKYEPNRIAPLLFMRADNEAKEEINNYAFLWMNNFSNQDNIYQIIDSLRHAFVSFAYNGLYELYTRQENEVWYPKIVLNEVLEPNDIDVLDDPVTIYRGCGDWEYEERKYGQAWSTSKEIANDFAFRHYASQPWFDNDKRVVLEATYPKNKVLFSDQSIEHEVVVQTEYLTNVGKCT